MDQDLQPAATDAMSYARDEVTAWATGQVDQGADDHVDQVQELAERKFADILKLERKLRTICDGLALMRWPSGNTDAVLVSV